MANVYTTAPAPETIVVATDFSEASQAAVSTAGQLARSLKRPLTIVHVFQFSVQHAYRVPVEWMISTIRKDIHARLEAAAERLRKEGVPIVETNLIGAGVAAEEILAFLRGVEHPLLVIGTHARSGMERFFLGSTAEEVLRHATCPVITAGPHIEVHADPQNGFRKLLIATDFSSTSLAAIPVALHLAGAHPLMRVLHVATDEPTSISAVDGFKLARECIASSGISISPEDVECILLHGANVSQAVTNEAERLPIDLLVLGVRRSSAFTTHLGPKVAFQTIAASPCPVLTVSS